MSSADFVHSISLLIECKLGSHAYSRSIRLLLLYTLVIDAGRATDTDAIAVSL